MAAAASNSGAVFTITTLSITMAVPPLMSVASAIHSISSLGKTTSPIKSKVAEAVAVLLLA